MTTDAASLAMVGQHHHWHRDTKSKLRETMVGGSLCVPVACCHCGAQQYAKLAPHEDPRAGCGKARNVAAGEVVEIVGFAGYVAPPKEPRKRKAGS